MVVIFCLTQSYRCKQVVKGVAVLGKLSMILCIAINHSSLIIYNKEFCFFLLRN